VVRKIELACDICGETQDVQSSTHTDKDGAWANDLCATHRKPLVRLREKGRPLTDGRVAGRSASLVRMVRNAGHVSQSETLPRSGTRGTTRPTS
jgi:hypothetical protein